MIGYYRLSFIYLYLLIITAFSSNINNFRGLSCHVVKINCASTDHHYSRYIPFHAHAPFPALLPCLKCILEIVFCACVPHRLWFCLGQLSCVKMAVSSFGETEKFRRIRWIGDYSNNHFDKMSHGENCALSWGNSHYFRRRSSTRRVHTFSRSCRKRSQ